MEQAQSRNKFASEETITMYNSMEKKLDEMAKQLTNIEVELAKMPGCIIEKTDSRYASKRVEKVMWAMFGAIGMGFLASLLKLILN